MTNYHYYVYKETICSKIYKICGFLHTKTSRFTNFIRIGQNWIKNWILC